MVARSPVILSALRASSSQRLSLPRWKNRRNAASARIARRSHGILLDTCARLLFPLSFLKIANLPLQEKTQKQYYHIALLISCVSIIIPRDSRDGFYF